MNTNAPTPDHHDDEAAVDRVDEAAVRSRGEAMELVEAYDLDQPLRRFLTDDELDRAAELCREVVATLDAEGHDAAALFVHATIVGALHDEQGRREQTVEELRIDVEAGGHEARLECDEVQHGRDGSGWYGWCSCGWYGPLTATSSDAEADVREHFGEVGGGVLRDAA